MIYERAGAIIPRGVRDWLKKEITYSGVSLDAGKFAGFILLESLSIGLVCLLLANFFLKLGLLYSVAAGIGGFTVIFIGIIYFVDNISESRGKAVEKILPDALQLIASNIKSGLTTERSLFVSARPEFAALSDELRRTSKLIMVGERLERALLTIPNGIKSRVLDRTMWLIAEGIHNGGQVANLLLQLSADLREENALKAEISANISMYFMLIFFSAAFGAPLLFGISSFIVGVLAEQTGHANIPVEITQEYGSKSPALGLIGNSQSNISEEFIVGFSMIDLFITSIFASAVLGIVSTGNEKGGIKFLFPLLVISFILFFIVRIFIKAAFGGMVT
jgi:flagellar protein FlaJ